MRQFTLFVVEDDQAVANALAGVAHLMQISVQLHESADDFLRNYDASHPGCLILDFKLPGMSGIDLQTKLNELGALLPVIMISGHGGVKTAVKALKLGAITFFEKPFDLAELCQAIREAAVLDQSRRQRSAEREAAAAKIEPLTKKEREVFSLVAEGVTNTDIASRLGISVRAVEDRRSRMMRKLQVENLEQILALHRASFIRSLSAHE